MNLIIFIIFLVFVHFSFFKFLNHAHTHIFIHQTSWIKQGRDGVGKEKKIFLNKF